MSLDNHIAVLTQSSLAVAVANKKKPTKPNEFYAVFAFPPAAAADLQAICQQVIGPASLSQFEVGIQTNAQKGAKAVPGIPGDWFIVRAATQYAPYIAAADGSQLDQSNPVHAQIIKTAFYAGRKVRAALSAYTWIYDGRHGISFNIEGVMDAAEEGERLNIGQGKTVNAFAAHAKPGAVTGNVAAMNANAETRPANNGNPFAVAGNAQSAAAPAAQGGNPFAQAAGSNNPFAAQ